MAPETRPELLWRSTERLLAGDARAGWAALLAAEAAGPGLLGGYAEAKVHRPEKGRSARLPSRAAFVRRAGRDDPGVPTEVLLARLRRLPPSGPVRAWQGALLRRLLRYDEAVAALTEAMALGERHPALLVWRGEARLQVGDMAGLADLGAAARRASRTAWVRAWCGRARVFYADGRGALPHLDAAVRLEPAEGLYLGWRAEAKRRLGRPGALEDFRRALRLDPGPPDNLWLRAWYGLALLSEGRPRRALVELARVCRKAPDYGPARWGLCWALRRLGRYEDWAESLDRAARLDPKYPLTFLDGSSRELAALRADLARAGDGAAARAWRGWCAALAGEGEAALRDLDGALRARPRDPWTLAFRAQAAQALGRADARARAARALAADPENVLALVAAGRAALAAGDVRAGARHLARACRAHPATSWLLAESGAASLMAGDAARALEALTRATARHPDFARAYVDASVAALRLRDPRLAKDFLARAWRADPEVVRVRRLFWGGAPVRPASAGCGAAVRPRPQRRQM